MMHTFIALLTFTSKVPTGIEHYSEKTEAFKRAAEKNVIEIYETYRINGH